MSDTFGLLPWWWLQDQGIRFGLLRLVALGIGLLAAAAFVAVPRRFALAFSALAIVYLACSTLVVENGRHGLHQTSVGSLWAGIRTTHPDWIDRAVGRDASVAFLWHYTGETRPLWNNEFFNRSVGTVYTIDGPDPADGGLPETPVRERRDGTLVTAAHVAPHVRYAVSYADIAGQLLVRDPGIGLGLYRVDGPLVVLTRVEGLYANDTWAGRHVSYRRSHCTGGTLSVRLGTDAKLFAVDQVVTARESGRLVARLGIGPTEQPTLRVPLHPSAAGMCTVTFTAATAHIPADVQEGSADTRALAVHYFAFDYTP